MSQPGSTPIAPAPLLTGKRIAVGVTGSVAAYKAAHLCRLLVKEGAQVSPVLSRGALRFVGEHTFSGLTGSRVVSDLFESTPGEVHVDLAAQTDLIVVAPATADCLARFATGRADDVLAALVLAARTPVLVAPAMHPAMWAHPAVQRNVRQLASDGRITFLGPTFGEVASGETGVGRMVEPELIVSECRRHLTPQTLAGRKLVVTSGPTVEDLDPVRFLGNRSSGKMGYYLAERARFRGAEVTLILGPSTLEPPPGVSGIRVHSTRDLEQALGTALGADQKAADALIMAAAVADYRPAEVSTVKRKRSAEPLELRLLPNPDLLAEIGRRRAASGGPKTPVLIGFAVETGNDDEIEARAREKLSSKGVDLIVANHGADALGRDDNRAQLVGPNTTTRLHRMAKADLAERILDQLVRCFE